MSTEAFERPARDQWLAVVQSLRARGYTVQINPTQSDLPDELRNFAIDAIARQGDETIVFQVKSRESAHADRRLDDLAEAISRLPGYRAELVWVGDELSLRPKPSLEAVTAWADRAARLHEADASAALLVMWIALELLIDNLAEDNGIDLKPGNTQRGLTSLYSLGVLSESQYRLTRDAWRQRSSLAHTGKEPDVDLVPNLLGLVRGIAVVQRLENPNFVSSDEMVYWFLENYEDPAVSVPYDSREGGYQYVAGGPLHAKEVLDERFASAPPGEVAEAVRQLEQESSVWVRKKDYS